MMNSFQRRIGKGKPFPKIFAPVAQLDRAEDF